MLNRRIPEPRTVFVGINLPALVNRALPLALPLLVAGCSSTGLDHRPSNQAGDFYLAAQNCRAVAAYKPTVRLNRGGGIADIEMDAGYDESRYGNCMVEQGWAPKIIDKTRQDVADCHAQSLKQAAVTQSGADPHLKPATVDMAAFEQCLQKRGFESEVLVEPLQPVQPGSKRP